MIDQAEQWRPDAAVAGWVAGCTCGWRGTPLDPRTTEAGRPRARRLATADPWTDLAGRRRAPGDDRMAPTHRWVASPGRRGTGRRPAGRRRTRALNEAVPAALAAGAPAADISRVTGMTARSATEHWSARD